MDTFQYFYNYTWFEQARNQAHVSDFTSFCNPPPPKKNNARESDQWQDSDFRLPEKYFHLLDKNYWSG